MEETVKLEVLINTVSQIKEDVTDIKHKLENNYVTQEEFKLIRNLVYGFVGILLVGIVMALLKLVILQ